MCFCMREGVRVHQSAQRGSSLSLCASTSLSLLCLSLRPLTFSTLGQRELRLRLDEGVRRALWIDHDRWDFAAQPGKAARWMGTVVCFDVEVSVWQSNAQVVVQEGGHVQAGDRWRCKNAQESFLTSLIAFHSTSPPSFPFFGQPGFLKLPASSWRYEPCGFWAAGWGRSHALLERKKGRKTVITIAVTKERASLSPELFCISTSL